MTRNGLVEYALTKHRIFVAYGGTNAETVAVDMVKCLRRKKNLRLFIATPGLKESIDLSSEDDILKFEANCDALFAVSTDDSGDSPKFRDEVEQAKYHSIYQMPVVGFLKRNAQNMLLVLETGCSRVKFDNGKHKLKCGDAARMIRQQLRRPQIVNARQRLRRRSP